MPVTAPGGSLWRVSIHGNLEDQNCINVLDFSCPVGSANVETDLVIALIQCFITTLLPVLTSKYTLESVHYKQIAPVLSNDYIYTPTGTTVGGVAGDSEPSFVAALFSKQTALGGKTHHGRMYIAGIPESETIGSYVDSDGDLWPALAAFAACVLSKFVIGDPPVSRVFVIGVFSRKLGGETFPANVAGFTPLTALIPHRELATQRSRKIGRGR